MDNIDKKVVDKQHMTMDTDNHRTSTTDPKRLSSQSSPKPRKLLVTKIK